MKAIVYIPLLAALAGCARLNSIVTSTQTGLGVSVSENPSTQLYEIRFGYFRNEFAFVPGNTNEPATVPNVMMEIRMENILKGGLVYQRLCVGTEAVKQPGAALLFAKGQNGTVDARIVEALTQSGRSIPTADAPGTASKVPMAKAYMASDQKAKFDVAAVTQGYESFADFLSRATLTATQVGTMLAALKAAGIPIP